MTDKDADASAAQDKAAQENAAQDKATQDKVAQESAAQDKAGRESAAQESAQTSSSAARGDTSRVLDEISKHTLAKPRPRGGGWRRFFIIVFLIIPVLFAIGFLLSEQSRTEAVLRQLQNENLALKDAVAEVSNITPTSAPEPLRLPDNLANTGMLDDLRTDLDSRINALARNAASIQERISALPQERVEDMRRDLDSRINALARDAASIQEQLSALPRERVEDLRAEIDSRIDALARDAASVQERLSALRRERVSVDWMWEETEYLLRLANQKLQLEGDGDSALLILSAVDQILRDSGEMSVLGVRDTLASEIVTLRAMDYIDISGLYMRLDNLLPIVEQLSLREAVVANYNEQFAQAREESVASDAGMFDKGIALLESIFVWQDWDAASEVLLAPPQEAVVKQNLRLILEQAQLALLMAEPEIYRNSLEKGVTWIEQYFSIDPGPGRTLREELSSLSQTSIIAQRPDISGSLELLRQVSAEQNSASNRDGR